jgi:hypothetical protein
MIPHIWERAPQFDQNCTRFLENENKSTGIMKANKCTRCGIYQYTFEDKSSILSKSPAGVTISTNLSDDCDSQIISTVHES